MLHIHGSYHEIRSQIGKKWKSFANEVLRARFEAGENAIIKDLHFSTLYALNIIKGRFEIAEKSEHSYYACVYAICVLKSRFLLREKIISQESYFAHLYNQSVIGFNHE